MITRAIELGEYHTAEQGIDGFQDILIGTIDYLNSEFDDEEATAYVKGVCEEPLTTYFPPLLDQLYSHEQYDLVKRTVNSIEEVAIYSVDCGFSDVAADAAKGLGDAFDAAPMNWEGNRIRQSVTETLVKLTKTTASKSGYGVFSAVVFQLNHKMILLLRRKAGRDVTYSLVGDYYRRDSVEVFEELLERYAPELEGEDINWVSPTDGRQWTLPSEAEPLRDHWRNYTSLTREVLRYRASEEQFPFVEGSIDDGWKDFITSAAESDLDGLATLCCITTIQLAYRVHLLEDGPVGFWTNNLARVRLEYDSRIVDRAFEILISGREPEGQNIQVHNYDPTMEEEEGGFLRRVFSGSDDEVTFEDWVEQFREDVLERTESLRN